MKEQIKTVYSELFQFLKKPVDKPAINQTYKEKARALFLVLILDILLVGISSLFMSILEKYGLFSIENHKILEFIKSTPVGTSVILAVIILPMLEELIFRLYLRYKHNYLLRLFISLFYVAGKNNKEQIEKRIKKAWYTYYGYVFYFSALLFGVVHLTNFNSPKDLLLLFPIITAPQILAGIFSGYLRVRYNWLMGYFLHVIHNLIMLLPFIFMGDAVEVVNKDTNDYSIQIEEVLKNVGKPEIILPTDTAILLRNYTIKDAIALTRQKDLRLIDLNNSEIMNKVLNVRYKEKLTPQNIEIINIENELANLYHFNIEKENKLDSVWTLSIVDSLKLNKFRTDSIKGAYLKYSSDSAVINRTEFKKIAEAINNSKKKSVVLKDTIPGTFNIRLSTRNAKNLRLQLDSIYGLQLVDTIAMVEYIIIAPKKEE